MAGEGLRAHIGRVLRDQAEAIAADAVLRFPSDGLDAGDEVAASAADLVLETLAAAVCEGEADPYGGHFVYLHNLTRGRRLTIHRLFTIVHVIAESAVARLAADPGLGTGAHWWPTVERITRRASFDVLAAFAQRADDATLDTPLTDHRTALHTRAVLLAALDKEIQRSDRQGHGFALLVVNVADLGEINRTHGFDVGDHVLARIGVVLRNHFRDQDWVSRSADDTFAVLLPEASGGHVDRVAARVREALDLVSIRDPHTGDKVALAVRVAVAVSGPLDATVGAEDVLQRAELAVLQARTGGVAHVVLDLVSAPLRTVPAASPRLRGRPAS
jgi:two-component system cell cycle response regulator